MRLVILDTAANVSEWAARYIVKRINDFNPGPDNYFVLGLPTGQEHGRRTLLFHVGCTSVYLLSVIYCYLGVSHLPSKLWPIVHVWAMIHFNWLRTTYKNIIVCGPTCETCTWPNLDLTNFYNHSIYNADLFNFYNNFVILNFLSHG